MVQMEANLETVIRISIRPAPSSTQSQRRRRRAGEEGSRAARSHRSQRADPELPRTHAPTLLSRHCRRRRRRSGTPCRGPQPPPAGCPPAPGSSPAQGAAAASRPAPAREAARRTPRPARWGAGSAEALMPGLLAATLPGGAPRPPPRGPAHSPRRHHPLSADASPAPERATRGTPAPAPPRARPGRGSEGPPPPARGPRGPRARSPREGQEGCWGRPASILEGADQQPLPRAREQLAQTENSGGDLDNSGGGGRKPASERLK